MNKKEVTEVVKALEEQGWRVEHGSKHYRAFSPDKTVAPVTIPVTPSDPRGMKNLISLLRRGGFVWPWNAQTRKEFKKGER